MTYSDAVLHAVERTRHTGAVHTVSVHYIEGYKIKECPWGYASQQSEVNLGHTQILYTEQGKQVVKFVEHDF